MEIIPLGTEMIVDDVEGNGHAMPVGRVHEPLESIRTAVGLLEHAVIAPVPCSGKLRDGHELHNRYPEFFQIIEAGNDRIKGPLRGKGPDMKFVDDILLEG